MSAAAMIVTHKLDPAARRRARQVEARLIQHGIQVNEDEGAQMVIALGGDGTVLDAAQQALAHDVPLIGINLGHMGFLTEAEVDDLDRVVDCLCRGEYTVEKRMTLDVSVTGPGGQTCRDFAINEAAIVTTSHAHPAHMGVGVDGHGISTYGADGMIIATPTGSTAYCFSAGGPIVWPDVEAVVMAPLSAHGLFTRPLVISPSSVLEVAVSPEQREAVEMWCDGLRRTAIAPGSVVRTTRGRRPLRVARVGAEPFAGRLVHKFDLPVKGWRCRSND